MTLGRKLAIGAAALTGIALLVAAAIWLMRKDIARNYFETELKRRGVTATYEISEIGPAQQRLEKLVIGNPARPDLTAELVIVKTKTGLSGVSFKSVRASGVRLNGRYIKGVLDLGAVNKLLPQPDDKPFSLPDFDVTLDDARMRLATDWGEVGLRLDGKGNIASNFTGQLAAIGPNVSVGGCTVKAASAYVSLTTLDRRISVKGPVRAGALACSGVKSGAAEIQLDGVTDERFAKADGDVRLRLGSVSAAGVSVGTLVTDARVEREADRLRARGNFAARALMPDRVGLDRIAALLRKGTGTPVGRVGEALAMSVRQLGKGSDVNGQFALAGTSAEGLVTFAPVLAASQSGARLRLERGGEVRLSWPSGALAMQGQLALQGGGFPASQVQLTARDGRMAGTARIDPLSAGNARIVLGPVRFALGRGVEVFDTIATMDGELAGGQVRGLVLPLALRNGAIAGQCLSVAFQSYAIGTLTLAAAKPVICQRRDTFSIARPDFAGRLGSAPMSLTATSLRFGTDDNRFALDKPALRLGSGDSQSRLDLSSFDGRIINGAASGQFKGAAGHIGKVPLLLSEGAGDWRFARSVLSLSGIMRVADAAKEPRFQPLSGRDFALQLADGRISAKTRLFEPMSNTAVADVTIAHALGPGTGHADLSVAGLEFGQTLQPEALTTITLGVIANVEGKIAGSGRIDWGPDGVTRSTGGFRTDTMNLAAAFGPVTGLKGEIALSDLLGLETPSGQLIELGSVNPGIAVTGGQIRYRLLPGLKAEVEGGRWPFAGGELILEPAVLDLSTQATRRLTFRVVGLDAALFVQQMAFENIAVTGKFDGVLPMVFDQNGGRIENGELVVRESGGTLSYVGEVTNADLGRFAKLAFDALKSIRYKKLRLELNGSLDGEMVTLVRFDGVNQLPLAQTKNFFLKQFNEIPFIFNITIRAPFRGLFQTARSLNDPSIFLPNVLPPQFQVIEPNKPVQTKESDPVR